MLGLERRAKQVLDVDAIKARYETDDTPANGEAKS
jgi:hypothetical protein